MATADGKGTVTGKGDENKQYQVHGDGVSSLWAGFDEIAMPEHRRREALAIVHEVVDANSVCDFKWYKTDGKDELCCYWDSHTTNALWITSNNVHLLADTSIVRRPPRAVTWNDQKGACVGWLLPGGGSGTGGGRRKARANKVMCPETFIWQPAGTVCAECDEVHS